MAGKASSAKGSKLYLKSGASFVEGDIVANLTSIGELGGSVDELDSTDLDSGDYKEFVPSMKDGGTIAIAGNFKVGSDGYTRLKAQFDKSPTALDVIAEWGIAHPTIVEANAGFEAYVAELKVGERTATGLMAFTGSLRVSGAIGDFTPPGEGPAVVDLEAELALHQFDYEDTGNNPFNMNTEATGYTAGDATIEIIVSENVSAIEYSASYPSFPTSPSYIINEADVLTAGVIDQAKFQIELIKACAAITDQQAYFVTNDPGTKDMTGIVVTLESGNTVVRVFTDNNGDTTFTLQINTGVLFELNTYNQGA